MAISFVRTLILYVLIVAAMRIMGKRQMGELEPSELVVAVLISDLAAIPLQDTGIPLLYGIVPALTLVACEILVSAIVIKNIRLRAFICGKPNILVKNGEIVQSEMKKNRFTLDELGVELRKQGISDISTVQYAILETDGTLSILLYPDSAPATPKLLGIKAEPEEYPVIVINEGRIIGQNLGVLGLDRDWLMRELKNRQVKNVKDVYIMSVTAGKKIFFLKKETAR